MFGLLSPMSLFSSIQVASGALQAAQIGLQVVGQNIANANTPGYAREQVEFTAGPTQQIGNLSLGTGVQVQGVVRQVDQFLQQRLNSATSDSSSTQVSQQTYTQLEGLLNELGTNGLSSSLDDFFSSISDVLNQPESDSVRNLAVLKGQTVTQDVNQLASQTEQLRSDLNDQVSQDANSINSLLTQIGNLNIQIESAEGGGTSASDAVGLADQRDGASFAIVAIDECDYPTTKRRHRVGVFWRAVSRARRNGAPSRGNAIDQSWAYHQPAGAGWQRCATANFQRGSGRTC